MTNSARHSQFCDKQTDRRKLTHIRTDRSRLAQQQSHFKQLLHAFSDLRLTRKVAASEGAKTLYKSRYREELTSMLNTAMLTEATEFSVGVITTQIASS